MKLVEAYGTGIRRILKLYENCSVQPSIVVTHNTFKMILPNMNATNSFPKTDYLTPQKEQILNFASHNGQIAETEIMELLGIKKTRAYALVKQMYNENLLIPIGRGTSKKYLPQK